MTAEMELYVLWYQPQEGEAGGSEIKGQPWMHSTFKVNLGYIYKTLSQKIEIKACGETMELFIKISFEVNFILKVQWMISLENLFLPIWGLPKSFLVFILNN